MQFSANETKMSMKPQFPSLIIALFFSVELKSQSISPLIMGQSYHFTKWENPRNAQIQIFGAVDEYTDSPTPTAWPKVTESGARLVRVGGEQYNIGSEKPLPGQEVYYVSIVDDIRKNGCEPVLTLPFLLTTTNTVQPNASTQDYTIAVELSIARAKTILNLLNIIHKRNIKYVIIGNEPDKDYGWEVCTSTANCPNGTLSAVQVASNIAEYIKPIAEAVKLFDPSIKIIGPEYTHLLPKVYELLLTPNNTTCSSCYIGGISGTTGQPFIDYASVHMYGPNFNSTTTLNSADHYSPTISAWTHSVTFCNIERYAKHKQEPLNEARRYRGALRYLRQKCKEINDARPFIQTKIGFMVTEMNSSHDNGTVTAVNDPSGNDTRSMQGAQNLARMYSLAMEYGAASVMMWSVKEGGGGGTADDRGYLDDANEQRRGTWFHYKKLADHFRGTYLRDQILANYATGASGNLAADDNFTVAPNPEWLHFNSSSTESAVVNGTLLALNTASNFEMHLQKTFETKAFAVKGQFLTVMILNLSSSSQSVALRFDGSSTLAASFDYKRFSFSAGGGTAEVLFDQPSGATRTIEPNSTTVLTFSCSGTSTTIISREEYREGTEAQNYDTTFSLTAGSTPTPATVSVSAPSLCLSSANSGSVALVNAPASTIYWYRHPSVAVIASGASASLAPTANLTLTPGTYLTKIVPNSGCPTFSVTGVLQKSSPLVDAGENIDFCSTSTGSLGNINLPTGQTYVWNPGGTTNPTLQLTTGNVTATTIFTLTASGNGCTATDQALVTASAGLALMISDYNQNSAHVDIGAEPNIHSSPPYWDSFSIFINNPNTLYPGVVAFHSTNSTTNVVNVHVITDAKHIPPEQPRSVYTPLSREQAGFFREHSWPIPVQILQIPVHLSPPEPAVS
jgi:hypothetical protein